MTATTRLPATFQRFRRLRHSEALRNLVAETRLDARDFVYPLFVTHGQGVRNEIASMPGQYQLSLDQLAGEARELRDLSIPAVLLFGLPASKDPFGHEAYAADGIVQNAARTLKDAAPALCDPCDKIPGTKGNEAREWLACDRVRASWIAQSRCGIGGALRSSRGSR